ncbi:MAG: altronate dehydratase [Lachnospiraceae bacterium]|nr:altronate dehydratase [Lachnospiraceae bacterium]
MQDWIRIHEQDTVAVAFRDLAPGYEIVVPEGTVVVKEAVARGHKIALRNLMMGENVIKYGNPIGYATKEIEAGEWVHTHNVATNLSDVVEYKYTPRTKQTLAEKEAFKNVSFQGFRREDGSVGIRNEIWIIPTVGCVNSVVQAMERSARRRLSGTVEDVIAFPHPYGCSQMGVDQDNTRKILADLISHPNAGGVLVVGLGCENSSIETIKPYLGEINEKRVKFLVCQEVEDEVAEAERLLDELIAYAGSFKREEIPANELVIGLKCGGSDGLSGITANPTVGAFSDLLTGLGGTTILTEVPEMFGAETLLMERCETKELFDKTVCMVNDFKDYFLRHGQTIYENPSPGNKAGGISTLEDKSLGCTQKSGDAPVADVLSYGERVKTKGLNLLSAPGNDLVASTALAASGAHMVLFTTGRGTPFAAPVPTVKISTNTALATKKQGWIDFDCGVLTECSTIEERAEELFSYVLSVASGKQVKAEQAGYHDMAIFKQGVTL